MVKVREKSIPRTSAGEIDLKLWMQRLDDVKERRDLDLVERACAVADACVERASDNTEIWSYGENCYIAGLEIAEIVADFHVGSEGLAAAILYRAVREERVDIADVEKDFGAEVAKLIRGVLRMAAIRQLDSEGDRRVLGQPEGQKDNVRKMLVSLVDDVRVALIKLAERTYAIRSVKNDEQKRMRVAREVFDVYAPLAHRLGIGQLKWELEDLSFRYLYADSYMKIARLLDGKRLDRQDFIVHIQSELNCALADAGVEGELLGRAKHIYSIWRKMQRKGIGFSQVYDVRAIRIIVDQVKDCYAALGVVHGLWRNIPNEFDDYIARPKSNGYRSLHTAVVGPENKVLEVQIRTRSMHEEAELGVCAHWRYKGSEAGGSNHSGYEEKIAWLRQVLDWHDETGMVGNGAEEISAELVQDRVYVFTPDGHVVSLTRGATPLDFAYHVHTEIGHGCRGAKVNGHIVPLTYELKTGDWVSILKGREQNPKRDWLQPALGYLRTTRARAKVQHWFKLQARDDNVAAGRALIEREFKRLALTAVDYQRVARTVQARTVEDMYAAVGAGDLSSAQVLQAAESLLQKTTELSREIPVVEREKVRNRGGIYVQGVGNLLTHMAGCCKPLPGDEIGGYVTVGRGVSIHRQDCAKLLQLQASHPHRELEVSWGRNREETYPVDLNIEAYDRPGLLSDITRLFADAKVNVLAVNTLSDPKSSSANIRLTIEVSNLMSLGHLLSRITRLPNIISANRLSEDGISHAG
ncbi:MAG: GTP pyrophosphokinase [Halieaceae bacterium]|jgi:GTP pyrophosphokinase